MGSWTGGTGTYNVTDTRYDLVDAGALDEQLRAASGIETPLLAVNYTQGSSTFDVVYVTEPTAEEKTLIDQAVADHTGAPTQLDTPTVENGKMFVEMRPRSGSAYEGYSVNWSDQTTWWAEAVKSENETAAATGDPLVFELANTNVINVLEGKITGERDLQGEYEPVVKVANVEQTIREFGYVDYEADPQPGRANPFVSGDYTIDYANGTINFFVAPAEAPTVTYYYANGSAWYVTPSDSRMLLLLAFEADFSSNIVQRDTVCFVPEIRADSAAAMGLLDTQAAALGINGTSMGTAGLTGTPGSLLLASRETEADPFYQAVATALTITVAQLKAAQGLPLADEGYLPDESRIQEYRRLVNFHVQSQRSYAEIPAYGGNNSRALGSSTIVLRWDYEEEAARELKGSEKVRVKIHLKHDVPFGGDFAYTSCYALSVKES